MVLNVSSVICVCVYCFLRLVLCVWLLLDICFVYGCCWISVLCMCMAVV